MIISVTAGVLVCLSLLVLRLLCYRRHSKADDQETDVHETSFQKSNTGETTIPNGFSDDISEIDADIDLTATLPISSVTRNDVSTRDNCQSFHFVLFVLESPWEPVGTGEGGN